MRSERRRHGWCRRLTSADAHPHSLTPHPHSPPPSPSLSAIVSSAKYKRVVCKLQACRFAICKRCVFLNNFVFCNPSLFLFLCFATCTAFFANSKRALCKLQSCLIFLLKHSPPFSHTSSLQGLPRAGRGCPGVAVAAKDWQGLPRSGKSGRSY